MEKQLHTQCSCEYICRGHLVIFSPYTLMKGENIETHGVSSFYYCVLEWVWTMLGRVKERVSHDIKI